MKQYESYWNLICYEISQFSDGDYSNQCSKPSLIITIKGLELRLSFLYLIWKVKRAASKAPVQTQGTRLAYESKHKNTLDS